MQTFMVLLNTGAQVTILLGSGGVEGKVLPTGINTGIEGYMMESQWHVRGQKKRNPEPTDSTDTGRCTENEADIGTRGKRASLDALAILLNLVPFSCIPQICSQKILGSLISPKQADILTLLFL